MIDDFEETQVQISYNSRELPAHFQLGPDASPEERRHMARVVARFIGPSTPMDDCFNKTVQVMGTFVHPVSLTDMNTGEVVPKLRTVWLLTDGTCLSSVSEVTRQFTEMVLQPFFSGGKLGLFDFPASVEIRKQKTRAGRTTFAFELQEESK